jgi:hypothetical protein
LLTGDDPVKQGRNVERVLITGMSEQQTVEPLLRASGVSVPGSPGTTDPIR